MSDDEEYDECDRCSQGAPDERLHEIALEHSYTVCEACRDYLTDSVEHYDWQERYTEEQHEKAIEAFKSREEFECVISDYDRGMIVLHTPYVSSEVVTDFCNHFGFHIVEFGPVWEREDEWPCLDSHGDTFQITLQYRRNSKSPAHVNVAFIDNYINDLDENDRQF